MARSRGRQVNPDTKNIAREKAKRVFAHMHDGMSMRKACREEGIAPSNLVFWCDEDVDLAEQYESARTALLDHWAEDIIDIADEPVGSTDNGTTDSGAVAKQRLQVDSRKWILSKLNARKYGDKLQTENTTTLKGELEVTSMTAEQREARIAELAAKAGYTG